MLLNNEKVYIGFDLSYEYAQISYWFSGNDEPETYAVSEREEQFHIPVSLFKRKDINQWFIAKEAENFAKQEEGSLFKNLYALALEKNTIMIEDEEFETIALLALFVKRALALPKKVYKYEKIEGIMFTVPILNEEAVSVLERLSYLLQLPEGKVFFQGREESIYQYVLHQPAELWKEEVTVFDGNENELNCIRLIKNEKTTPVVVFSKLTKFNRLEGTDEEKDDEFLNILTSMHLSSSTSVFLIGDQFRGDWCQESLRTLCHKRRVFKGNNLYSKGACYSIMDRMSAIEKKNYVFLGKDKLKTNIGMQVRRNGEDSYLAILDGGENWYECKKEFQIILPEGNILSFLVTPLDGRNIQNVEIVLEGLEERPKNMTRLKIQAEMSDEFTLDLTIEDMGFGEFYKASDLKFKQQINLAGGGYEL